MAADDKEGGRCLSLDEDGQDLGGDVRPGAVVEGQRHRQLLPSVQDGLGRTGCKRPHRVAGPVGRKLLVYPGHGLDPGPAGDDGDPVAAVQASGCCCWLAVDQHCGG